MTMEAGPEFKTEVEYVEGRAVATTIVKKGYRSSHLWKRSMLQMQNKAMVLHLTGHCLQDNLPQVLGDSNRYN